MTVLATLGGLWRSVSRNIRTWCRLPHVITLVAHYTEVHRVARFAGNLEKVIAAYAASNPEARADLSQQFDSIVDQLTMPNGVTKTTHAERYTPSLSAALSVVQLARSEISVLDLPASTGIASLKSLALLQRKFRVRSYVLADLYHSILYDSIRRCIFDERGNLLQVGFRHVFFSLYRCGVLGERYNFLTRYLSFPHDIVAWYFRKRYRFEPDNDYRRLLVVHPELQLALGQGVYRLKEMDLFKPIPGRYDLILSFHLLQRLYFPSESIQAGIKNLAASLSDGGLLILGGSDSFVALQKQNGSLIARVYGGASWGEFAPPGEFVNVEQTNGYSEND